MHITQLELGQKTKLYYLLSYNLRNHFTKFRNTFPAKHPALHIPSALLSRETYYIFPQNLYFIHFLCSGT